MAIKKNEAKETVKKDLEVTRAIQFDDNSVVFDITINGVAIYGCRIVEGKKGDFVSFPSHKGKDGKYYSYAYIALSAEDVSEIENQINDHI